MIRLVAIEKIRLAFKSRLSFHKALMISLQCRRSNTRVIARRSRKRYSMRAKTFNLTLPTLVNTSFLSVSVSLNMRCQFHYMYASLSLFLSLFLSLSHTHTHTHTHCLSRAMIQSHGEGRIHYCIQKADTLETEEGRQ